MTISLGTQLQVDASGFFANIVKLTASTAICFYSTAGGDIVAAKHLTLSGTTISAGSKLVVDNTVLSTFGRNIRSVRLTDTSALIAYSFNGSAHKARVITVSGTTLTAHSAVNLTDSSNIWGNSLDFLTSTAVIYVYNDNGGTAKARVLTISGTTVTENSAFTYDANGFNGVVAALSATKAVVVFADSSNSDAVTGEVLDISGTTVTGNADQSLSATPGETSINYRIAAAMLDSTHIIVQWFRTVVGSNLYAVAVSESGGSLSAGTTIVPQSGNADQDNVLAALSSTRALGVMDDVMYEYSISGTTVTKIDAVNIPNSGENAWITALDSVTTIIAYDSSIEAIPAIVNAPAFSGYDLVLGGGQP